MDTVDDILHKLGVLRGVLRHVAPGEIKTVEDAGREIERLQRRLVIAEEALKIKDELIYALRGQVDEVEAELREATQ